jgi:HPt (histidine-containing phosphotransfer) domain-containing protein
MRKAVIAFTARLPTRVNSILSVMGAGDLEELRVLVHQLKGAGTGYGFPNITQEAAHTEALIKTSADIEEIRACVHDLVSIIRRVENYNRNEEKHVNSEAIDHR